MSDDLRRQDDVLLASLDKRLALLELAHKLQGQAEEARGRAIEKTIDSLAVKVDSAIALWTAANSEPAGSAAGRQLSTDLVELRQVVDGDLRRTLNQHEAVIQQQAGAFRLARAALGTSALAAVAVIVQIIVAVSRP